MWTPLDSGGGTRDRGCREDIESGPTRSHGAKEPKGHGFHDKGDGRDRGLDLESRNRDLEDRDRGGWWETTRWRRRRHGRGPEEKPGVVNKYRDSRPTEGRREGRGGRERGGIPLSPLCLGNFR